MADPADLPWGPRLRQPDRFTCGPSSVVVAHVLADPAYAARVLPRFGDEVLATHRRVRGWPRLLGTPPWEVARLMPGDRRVRWARLDPGGAWDRTGPGDALYVGSATLPRHVLLVLEADGEDRLVYDPAHGGRTRRTRSEAVAGQLQIGSWQHLWAVVVAAR